MSGLGNLISDLTKRAKQAFGCSDGETFEEYLKDYPMEVGGVSIIPGYLSHVSDQFTVEELSDFRLKMDDDDIRSLRIGHIGEYNRMLSGEIPISKYFGYDGKVGELIENDLAHVDKVIGAKGSGFQMRFINRVAATEIGLDNLENG